MADSIVLDVIILATNHSAIAYTYTPVCATGDDDISSSGRSVRDSPQDRVPDAVLVRGWTPGEGACFTSSPSLAEAPGGTAEGKPLPLTRGTPGDAECFIRSPSLAEALEREPLPLRRVGPPDSAHSH
jgi:hypothetical protein